MSTQPPSRRILSVFSLVMITIVSVDSIRNLPATALFGSSLVFFFLLGSVFFLLPSALVSAELASGWPEQGGIYVWVKEAFGPKAGFLAIWFQWIENVFWYPTILSFVAGTLGYLIAPSLAANKLFLVSVILIAFWGATLVNWFGMRSSAWFSSFCALAGLLVPMTLIISLGATWLYLGEPLQIHLNVQSMLPNFADSSLWVSLTGIILSFCGMEMATVHARDVKNPQRAFPRALIIATAIMLGTLILGSLAIAIVVPQPQISLVAGIMQAFNTFFMAYHFHWIMPLVAMMLVIGGMGGVSSWIIGPSKGLLVAGQDGHLPDWMSRENQHGAPSSLLLIQAVIVSLLSLLFLYMPSVNGSYWLLTALASQLYMLMYLMMFAASIWLRIKAPEKWRSFKIPGGVPGILLVAGAGMIGSGMTFFIGFIPPANISVGILSHYEWFIIVGLIVMILPPFMIRKRQIFAMS